MGLSTEAGQTQIEKRMQQRSGSKHGRRWKCLVGRNAERGGAIVEIALTLPVVMLIMTGIFSFSIALYQKLQLAEAVSNGGRVLAAERGQTDPCADVAAQIWATTQGLTKSNLKLTFVLNGTTVVNAKTGSGVTCSGDGGSPYMVSGNTAQVLASYSVGVGVYGMSYMTIPINAQVTEVVQ